MDKVQYKMSSPIGTLYLSATSKGLSAVGWDKQQGDLVKTLDRSQPQQKILDAACLQLREYFDGKRKQFDVSLDVQGTEFQRKVWKQLSKIPFGQTQSYKDIARKMNNPKAVRAVGSANGKNPVCVIVPCHRVIAANGTIGGYSGGLNIKRKLLDLEK